MSWPRYGSTWLRQAPLLVRSAAAGPDLELYSIGGNAGGVVRALAGGGIDQLSVDRLPLLVRTAVAGPPFDEGAVGGVVSGDIQAATVDGDGSVAVDGPALRGGEAVAIKHLYLVARRRGCVVVVQALGAVDTGDDRAGPGAASGLAVTGGHDVGLYRVLGGVRREAGGHHALVERTGGTVAVVPADPQDDGALQVERPVPAGGRQRSVVGGLQAAGVRIAVLERVGRRVHLEHAGDERAVAAGVVGVRAVGTGEQTVLQVGHDPRTRPDTLTGHDKSEPAQRAEVNRSHVPVAGVTRVGLRVAVVEAAATVHVAPGGDHVDPLRRAAGGDARGGVVPVAGAGRHEHAVGFVAADGDRGGGGVGQVVEAARCGSVESTGRRLGEVVAPTGLVIDDRDHTRGTGTERVLCGGVRGAARPQHPDVLDGVAPRPPHLIERTVVRIEQRAR